jgi:hypothetical protein
MVFKKIFRLALPGSGNDEGLLAKWAPELALAA